VSDQIFFDTGGRGLAVYGAAQTGTTLERIVRYMRSVRDPVVTEPEDPEDPPVPGVPSDSIYYITDHTAGAAERTIVDSQSIADWSLIATKTDNSTHVTHEITLTSETSATRACTLRYKILISRTGLVWVSQTTTSLIAVGTTGIQRNQVSDGWQEHVGANMYPVPSALWGGVQNNSVCYALCCDPLTPSVFQMEYNAATQEFYILFRLGFHTDVRSATVKFHTWTFPSSSLPARRILSDLYNYIAPTAYDNRILEDGGEHGAWYFIGSDVPALPAQTVADFGIRYMQGGTHFTSSYRDQLAALGVYRIRYTYGYDLHMVTLSDTSTYSATIAAIDALAADGTGQTGIRALAVQNAGVHATNGEYIYFLEPYWTGPAHRVVPHGAPGILPHPNHFYSEFEQYQTTLNAEWNGLMVDNNPYHFWRYALPTYKSQYMNFRTNHFQYMETPLSFDTTFRVGIHYDMMAAEFMKGCADWCRAQTKTHPVHANGGAYRSLFTYSYQDSSGWESTVLKAGNVWSPPTYAYIMQSRMKIGRKNLMFLINPGVAWSNWTNAMTEKILALSTCLATFPSFGVDPSKYRVWQDNTMIARELPMFKKYIPIIRTLSHAGWAPERNFTLSNSTIWGERYGELLGGNKTIYIAVFNPSTTTNVTFTLSSSTYSVPAPATFTELVSNTSRSWTAGNLTITLGPETVQVFRLTYS
jgi:hypothetical protein